MVVVVVVLLVLDNIVFLVGCSNLKECTLFVNLFVHVSRCSMNTSSQS